MSKETEEMYDELSQWYLEYEQRLWLREYGIGASLSEILRNHNMEELHNLRKMYHVKNASQLRKEELIERLAREIPVNIGDKIFNFDKERYELINKASKKGYVKVSKNFGAYKADYFNQFGILYPTIIDGEKTLIMPEEIIKEYKKIDQVSLKKVASRNTEVVKLFFGLLHYYGVLGDEQCIAWIRHYFKELDQIR